MGGNSSKLEKALGEFPENERYFGLENFGNTCYANSVLQVRKVCKLPEVVHRSSHFALLSLRSPHANPSALPPGALLV